MMYLLLFESDPALLPKDMDEKKKQWLGGIAMFREEMKNGNITAMGLSVSGNKGFILTNQSAKQVFAKRLQNLAVNSKVIPMLSLEEAEDVIKEL